MNLSDVTVTLPLLVIVGPPWRAWSLNYPSLSIQPLRFV